MAPISEMPNTAARWRGSPPAVGEVFDDGPSGQLIEGSGVAADRDVPVGQVDVVEHQIADGWSASGVDDGEGEHDALIGSDSGSDGCLVGVVVDGHHEWAGGSADGDADGGVAEDQAVAFGVAEQGPHGGDRFAAVKAGELVEGCVDVVGGDGAKAAVADRPVIELVLDGIVVAPGRAAGTGAAAGPAGVEATQLGPDVVSQLGSESGGAAGEPLLESVGPVVDEDAHFVEDFADSFDVDLAVGGERADLVIADGCRPRGGRTARRPVPCR
jgi:hypothetical protein